MSASYPDSAHSAAAAALGYLYQCRYALLEALTRLREQPNFAVSIETLDDIVVESMGGSTHLIQTKHHHVSRAANLTDRSPDLWKTLRVWSGEVLRGRHSQEQIHYLVTTSRAAPNSAAYFLRPDSRDLNLAVSRLAAVGRPSESSENLAGYEAFQKLGLAGQQRLLASIFVLDGQPTIMDVVPRLNQELALSVSREHVSSLRDRLEGWWFRKCVEHLSGDQRLPILGMELELQLAELREQFYHDNLPIDDDILDLAIEERDAQGRLFTRQLELIGVTGRRVFFALREYLRAYAQRSRWVREELLSVGELGRYEQRLVEEWETRFEEMRERLGDAAVERAKQEAARALYKWVEQEADFAIRPRCREPFITRGSYHMLADDCRVGWHPDFAEHLRGLLEGSARQS